MAAAGGGGAAAAAAPGVERMRNAFNALESTNQSLVVDLRSSLIMLKMIAEDLERGNDKDAVEELTRATIETILLLDDVAQHSTALHSLGEEYVAGNELTDFQKLIEERIAQLKADSPSDPENHPYYKQLKEAVWNIHHAGELMPGQENEDIVMTCSQFSIVNLRCPITGKAVVELDDPVRSLDCQHIYDHKAVMDYIKKQGTKKPCKCAAAGCPKELLAENLICDGMLKIEIEEMRRRGIVATQAQNVVDYTELED
eukprot:c19153_g1_i1 orf=371-1141(-)